MQCLPAAQRSGPRPGHMPVAAAAPCPGLLRVYSSHGPSSQLVLVGKPPSRVQRAGHSEGGPPHHDLDEWRQTETKLSSRLSPDYNSSETRVGKLQRALLVELGSGRQLFRPQLMLANSHGRLSQHVPLLREVLFYLQSSQSNLLSRCFTKHTVPQFQLESDKSLQSKFKMTEAVIKVRTALDETRNLPGLAAICELRDLYWLDDNSFDEVPLGRGSIAVI